MKLALVDKYKNFDEPTVIRDYASSLLTFVSLLPVLRGFVGYMGTEYVTAINFLYVAQ